MQITIRRAFHTLAILACMGFITQSIAAECVRKEPFLISPMLEGAPSAANLSKYLDGIEPGGPNGDIVLGYTLVIPLLDLFTKTANGWQFDPARLETYLNIVRDTDRPAVIHLIANHFSPNTELLLELVQDMENIMITADGHVPKSTYFITTLWPLTLSTDPAIPVNKYRFEALDKAMQALVEVDKAQPGKIRGITLFGELQHMIDNMIDIPVRYYDIQFTDYSQRSKDEFKAWLRTRYANIDALNKAARTSFRDWSEAEPPDRDMTKNMTSDPTAHIDSFAAGSIPIFGWIDRDQYKGNIQVYLDGKLAGRALQGFSRLDVYEQVESIKNPNTGFRFDVDFRRLPAGLHTVDLVLDDRTILAHRIIQVISRKQPSARQRWGNPAKLAKLARLPITKIPNWLDHPQLKAKVFFNPWAAIWQEFREHQVEKLYREVWSRAAQTGFDTRRLYSHQWAPYLNGTWNDMVFATALTNAKDSPYQFGFNTYGGQAHNDLLAGMIGNRPYGLPEFNPLLGKSPSGALEALQYHQDHCADFVSPYVMRVENNGIPLPGDFGAFLIDERNTFKGANFLYSAIKSMVAH